MWKVRELGKGICGEKSGGRGGLAMFGGGETKRLGQGRAKGAAVPQKSLSSPGAMPKSEQILVVTESSATVADRRARRGGGLTTGGKGATRVQVGRQWRWAFASRTKENRGSVTLFWL